MNDILSKFLSSKKIYNVEFHSFLTEFLHDCEEFDDDFGRRLDQDLSLPTLLSIIHVLKSIVKDADPHHLSPLIPFFKLSMRLAYPAHRCRLRERRTTKEDARIDAGVLPVLRETQR